MQTITADFRNALNVSHTKHTVVTVTTPDGEQTTLQWSSGSVSSGNDSGARYQARLTIVPTPGVDLYSIISTPGAIFRIRHGINFGAGFLELLDFGVYEAASGGVNVIDGDIDLTLVDLWQRIERCRFTEPYNPSLAVFPAPSSSRADLIAAAVTDAIPDATFDIQDDGGDTDLTGRVWDRDRTQFIKDIATDGQLDVYFNASGTFVIRKQPIINQDAVVWTFRTGSSSNIFTLDRERPFDRLYNWVVVSPIDEEQTWESVYVFIEDESNPRHHSKIGTVPYFYSSPTITSAEAAVSAAETILQRVQGTTETLSLGALGAPLEVGDTVNVVHAATASQPDGLHAVHIIDSWDYDLYSGQMTCKTRSSDLAELAEA